MADRADQARVLEVFGDVGSHRSMAELVRRHSTNRSDVREVALAGLDLTRSRAVLDLGCAFGFFTEALKGRVDARAVVTGVDFIGDYEHAYLETCARAGLDGRFLAGGVKQLDGFRAREFDLVLCSYALYFFPEMIPDIARVLTPDGVFVAITHDADNMWEMVSVIKELLGRDVLPGDGHLPLEEILARFSSRNGTDLLQPWFGTVSSRPFRNTLVFAPDEGHQILEYFVFKGPFLLSSTTVATARVTSLLSQQFRQPSFLRDGFTVSKSDSIFICAQPAAAGAQR